MRTLSLLKQGVILGALAVSMSGCLKSSDPDFTIGVNQVFVMQRGEGTSATYTPYISIYSPAYQIKSASVSFDGEKYSFSRIGLYGNTMEVSEGGFYGGGFSPSSSLPNGAYAITAIDGEGTLNATNGFTINIGTDRIMGAFNMKNFKYTSNNGFEAEWDAVTNATAYGLIITPLVKTQDGTTVSMGKNLFYWDEGKDVTKTSGKFNPRDLFQAGQEMNIAIAAYSSKNNQMPDLLVQVGRTIHITWGTDYVDGPVEE